MVIYSTPDTTIPPEKPRDITNHTIIGAPVNNSGVTTSSHAAELPFRDHIDSGVPTL